MGTNPRRALAGGVELRSRLYGTVVSTNLTPGNRAGWILRGLRGGLSDSGRQMHWRAMPWDVFSHWSEEDARAMQAYLHRLSPVTGALPAPRPPDSADPPATVLSFGDRARR